MRIAIFGGSFDPVHIAHKLIVQTALEELDIDKLIIVPTYLNPFKASFLFEPKTRFELLKKVFKDFPKVEICDFEINQKGLSYTYETISYIKELYNPEKIYFIIGEDNLANLHKWYKIDELKQSVEFVVATRANYASNIIKEFKTLDINIDISSTNLREQIDINFIPKEIQKDILNLQQRKKLNNRLDKIKAILDDKKATDIEVFDLRTKDYVVDYVVLATTLNPKHAFALLDYLKADLKPTGEEFLRVDDDEDWTVIDLGDIFIHLMSEKYREKYNLEEFLENFKNNHANG